MYEKIIIKTLPIPIPIQEQYCLITTRFNPPQNSPPSLWKIRLNKRIGDSPITKTQTV